MWQERGSADEIIEARGLKQLSDSGELETMVDKVIAANAGQVNNNLAADGDHAKETGPGFFVGQVMKLSKRSETNHRWSTDCWRKSWSEDYTGTT